MYLYGASGHSKVIKDILVAMGVSVRGVFDDNPDVTRICGIDVAHNYSGQSPIIISIGNNRIRKTIAKRLSCGFGKAIHPSAIISPSVTIGDGTVVMAGVIVNSEALIGNHCIINTCASVDHECIIGDYVHLSPHVTLCGNVHIGEGSWIGASATVIPGIKIGKWSVIGAGAVVINDVPDGVVVAGVPAKVIRHG